MRKVCLFIALAAAVCAQSQFTPGVKPFIAVDSPVIALEHVRILDGTGAPAREDQTIVIESGRIQAVGASDQVQVPAGAQRMALPDQTVIPPWSECMSICSIHPGAQCRFTSNTG